MNALGALCRKVARRRAEGDDSPIVSEPATVVDLMGPPPVPETRVGDRTGQPGVAVALAVTPDGGDVIFVEGSRMPGRGRLTLSGSFGDDMRESGQTAVLPQGNEKQLDARLGGDDVGRGVTVHAVCRIDEFLELVLRPAEAACSLAVESAAPLRAALTAGVPE